MRATSWKLRGASWFVALVVAAAACAPAFHATVAGQPDRKLMAEFWNAETNRSSRDLVNGPGGREGAPDPHAVYKLIKRESHGWSPKLQVEDPSGTKWSVKMGDEAQPEVVSSRIVWAMGYHQPPDYYLPTWTLEENGKRMDMPPARFRAKSHAIREAGSWSWHSNAFVNTQAFRGLIVLMMVLDSTDLKDDNNAVYELKKPEENARKWYVVKDLGASLGETGRQSPRRGDPDVFAAQGFVTGVKDGHVLFDYKGRHQELLSMVHPEDVRWMCEMLDRVSPSEWRDMFKAGGYNEAQTEKFVSKLHEKIAQGKALRAGA